MPTRFLCVTVIRPRIGRQIGSGVAGTRCPISSQDFMLCTTCRTNASAPQMRKSQGLLDPVAEVEMDR